MTALAQRVRSRWAFSHDLSGWTPLALLVVFLVAVGAYTQAQDSAYLSEFNLNGLLIAATPLALAGMAQTNALMVRTFDVSLGALITLGVVVASFTIPAEASTLGVIIGLAPVFGACLVVGGFNIILTRVLGLSSIIATIATLSILTGVALALRPVPEGSISREFADAMSVSVGFMPIGFVAVVVIAVIADRWLYRSPSGLTARAIGFDESSAARLGARVGWIFTRTLLVSATVGALASLFVAAEVGIGDPNVALGYTLTSIAAAILGGASLTGGRGSYLGAVVGALFLTQLSGIVPFIGLQTAWSQILVGGLTLVALCLYQAPALLRRMRGLREGAPGV